MAMPQDLAALGALEPEPEAAAHAPRGGRGQRGGGQPAQRSGAKREGTGSGKGKGKGPAHGRGGAHAKAAKALTAASGTTTKIEHPAAAAQPARHPRAHQLPSARMPSRRGRR